MAKASVVKAVKPLKAAHTSNSPKGTGDYYGTGVKNAVGKLKDSMIDPKIKSTKGKPPKALA